MRVLRDKVTIRWMSAEEVLQWMSAFDDALSFYALTRIDTDMYSNFYENPYD